MSTFKTMCCPKCKGVGEVRLPRILAEVLEIVTALQPCDNAAIFEELNSGSVVRCNSRTALSNRLVSLERAGLVARNDKPNDGRSCTWSIKEPTQ